MVSVWQIGVHLAGIGFLILCIFAATTVRDVGGAIKRMERILTDKNAEIESIIENSVSITNSVDGIASNVNKATNIVGLVASVSSHIADRFGKSDTAFDDDSEQMSMDDLIMENDEEIKNNL